MAAGIFVPFQLGPGKLPECGGIFVELGVGCLRRNADIAHHRFAAQGAAGPVADANSVPLPTSTQFFNALVDWVENKNAPGSLLLNSANASVSMPICPYPQKASYNGSGSPTSAASYTCR